MYRYNVPYPMFNRPPNRQNLYAPYLPEHFFPPSAFGENGNPGFPLTTGFPAAYQTIPFPSSGFSLDTIFEDPLYSDSESIPSWLPEYPYPNMPMNPFAINLKPESTNLLLQSFKGKDGQIDFNKMFSTAGQLMGIVNQVTGLVKGLAQLGKG